jgi:hypothetical protein
VLGRRRKAAANEADAALAATSAEAEAMLALAGAVARIDEQLREARAEQEQMRTVTDMSVQYLRATVFDTRSDLAQAVEHLASVCGMLAERIESERSERQALIETITQLAPPAPAVERQSGERVIGGSFDASIPEPIAIDVAPARPRWGRSNALHSQS